MKGGGSVVLDKDLLRVKRLFDNGKYMEACLYSFITLTKTYGYDEDEEFVSIIKNEALDLLVVLGSKNSTRVEKKIARELLNLAYGNQKVNSAIGKIAIVEDRNDSLVRKWKKHCLKRDEFRCKNCGDEEELCVHHISYWSDDPTNRVNPDNGVTLCKVCHQKEHEDDWFANFI